MKIWPLFDLRIYTPRLELRLPTDDLCFALAEVAAAGVHPPDFMPFRIPWTDAPSPQLERSCLQFWWRNRVEWTPENWSANFVVLHNGQPIGSQGILANQFAVRRAFESGSWLGQTFQGQGFGKEMRAAVLQFGFDGLNAEWAFSGADLNNGASNGVSAWIGYESDGHALDVVRGAPRWTLRYRLSREAWQRRFPELDTPVTIEGLEACRDWFGA